MKYLKLKWTDYAKRNIKLYTMFSRKTPENLVKYKQSLEQIINSLPNSPYLGKVFFEINNFKIRQLIHKEHRIIYFINQNKLTILALPHVTYPIEETILYISTYINNL